MKERPIIFNAEMIRAILAGRKTQTRRPVKPRPSSHHWEGLPGYILERKLTDYGDAQFIHTIPNNQEHAEYIKCPYGKTGDRLWVREKWAEPHYWTNDKDCEIPLYFVSDNRESIKPVKWKSSIHMPRWASRILLGITDIKVESLQDISEQDARREGVVDGGCLECGESEPCGCGNPTPCAIDGFVFLWNSIYKDNLSWNYNPLVWVVEFKRIND